MFKFKVSKSANTKCFVCDKEVSPRNTKKIVENGRKTKNSAHIECYGRWPNMILRYPENELSSLLRKVSSHKRPANMFTFYESLDKKFLKIALKIVNNYKNVSTIR